VPQSGVPAGGEPESRQAECRYRTEAELPPPSQCCRSPYDPDARSGRKRSTVWTGYVVHLTESCEADLPLFITDVQTTRAGEPEDAVLAQLQKELAQRELLPAVQLVDAGYITGKNLRDSREHYQVDLLGPDQQDTSWQAQAQAGFAATDFRVEWEQQYVTCPGGKQSAGWREREDRGRPVIKVHFHRRDCTPCAYRAQCTHAAEAGRALTLPSRPVWEALRTLRARQETAEFRRTCQLRAGIEGTHSQAERRCGVRRCRYVGEAKVRLQHLLTAAALNLVRWMEWLQETPRARTRRSAFVRLMAAA
jgi:transposase